MRMTPEELGRRLEEAARIRAVLRRATIDLREFGRLLLEEGTRGSRRSGHRRDTGR